MLRRMLLTSLLIVPAALSDDKGAAQVAAIFQVSTIDALAQGVFQGALSFRELSQHGDFGVGTLDGLDGELVALDGRFYQVRADGSVQRVKVDSTTPFAAVTTFHADLRLLVTRPMELGDLLATINTALPSSNWFYAVKVHGHFTDITTRSVPRQYPPFPPLSVAISQQTLFPLHEVDGTLVGFRSPAFVDGINQSGYHFHFITDDERAGGHMLSMQLAWGTVEIGVVRQHNTFLPDTWAFRGAMLPLP